MRKIGLATIATVALALSAGAVAAEAAAPNTSSPAAATSAAAGSLSAFEYGQLLTTRNRLKSVNAGTTSGLSTAIWDCQQIQMATELLTEERTDCVSQFALRKDAAQMLAYVADCAHFGTVQARLGCLVPVYRQLSGYMSSFYRAESQIHQLANARGLGESCADLLSDTPYVIAQEKLSVAAIAQIIAAAEAGRVPAFEAASAAAKTAMNNVASGQQSNSFQPSICPHQ